MTLKDLAHHPGLVDEALVRRSRDAIWTWFEEQGVRRDDPSTWPSGLVSHLQSLTKRRAVDGCETPELQRVVDDIVGPERSSLDSDWQMLITFPQRVEWQLPSRVWHLDIAGRGDPSSHQVAERPRLMASKWFWRA